MAGGLVAGVFFSSILSDGGQEGLAAPPCARGFYSSILSDGGLDYQAADNHNYQKIIVFMLYNI